MKFITIASLLFFTLSSNSMAHSTLTFTTADEQSNRRSMSMNAVLTECFRRMNITLDIIPMPSKRSLINANNGTEDGNFVRTAGITNAYPNLIKVPEKISVNRIMAFSKNKNIQVDGWKSLLKYHVAYVNGWRNCERELKNAMSITIVKNETLLFTLLEKNRADIGIFGQCTGLQVINELGYTDIKALEPPVVTSDLFLYIHKKNSGIIPEVVKTLKLMKKDGTYQGLIDKYSRGNKYDGRLDNEK